MALVLLFVVSYGIKLLVMGGEDRTGWSFTSLVVLYVHEACIATMLAAGAVAALRARRFDRISLSLSLLRLGFVIWNVPLPW